MSIKGPYVDGAFENKPGETVFYCVSCANEKGLPEQNAIMYHELDGLHHMECEKCGKAIREIEGET